LIQLLNTNLLYLYLYNFSLPLTSPDILALIASSYPLEWDSPAPPVALQDWAIVFGSLGCPVQAVGQTGLEDNVYCFISQVEKERKFYRIGGE
jgi:hypothetical protein